MTVRTSANIHFDEGDVRHRWHPGDSKCPAYGALKFAEGANIFFDTTAEIDTVIAELVALRAEMDPPVITCSERTCDGKHPETGDWCVAEGAHADHRDTYGRTWPAGQGGVLFNVGDEAEPCSPSQVLDAARKAGTPLLLTGDGRPV